MDTASDQGGTGTASGLGCGAAGRVSDWATRLRAVYSRGFGHVCEAASDDVMDYVKTLRVIADFWCPFSENGFSRI